MNRKIIALICSLLVLLQAYVTLTLIDTRCVFEKQDVNASFTGRKMVIDSGLESLPGIGHILSTEKPEKGSRKSGIETKKVISPLSRTQILRQRYTGLNGHINSKKKSNIDDDDNFMLPKSQLTSTTLNPFFIGANSRRKDASRQYSPRDTAKQPETATVKDDWDYDYDLTNRHFQ